jgi:branched-chain amino acid aminotransferase
MKIWMNGGLVDRVDARVSVLDHGLLYGDGIFEGLRLYGGRIFRLGDHLARLEAGAKALGLTIPGGTPALAEAVKTACRAHGESEAYIRLVVTRGEGPLGVDPTTCNEPSVICIVDRIALFAEEKRRTGLDLVTSSYRKPGPDMLDPRVKSLNYLNSVLAKREARRQGADEALVLNQQGLVAEASVANVFVVRRGVLQTPPTTDGALDGITRDSVLRIAKRLEIPSEVVSLGRQDLFAADECFLTGTGARIVSVGSLDGSPVGRAERPVTAKISAAFDAFAREHGTPP